MEEQVFELTLRWVVRNNQTLASRAAVEKGLPEVRTVCASAQAQNRMMCFGISRVVASSQGWGQEMKLKRNRDQEDLGAFLRICTDDVGRH